MSRLKRLDRLFGAQRDAVDPDANVWLAASAGTGKTHVLTSRVLRLLLRRDARGRSTDPATILCLTFTKAGAAEMAERIHARLADWVRLDDVSLARDLQALDEDFSPTALAHARRLFAGVLDARGGGLRIQTIHAFAAILLAGFPDEAGLVPGFRAMEEREQTALGGTVLADLLVEAEAGGDQPLIRDIQTLSRRLGEESTLRFLANCARAPDAMEALGAAQGIEAQLRRTLDVPSGDIEEALAEACSAERFDHATLHHIAGHNRDWGTTRGLERADAIARWIALSPAERAASLCDLHGVWAKADGEIRSFGKGQAPNHPEYGEHATRAHGACKALLDLRAKAAFAESLAAALRAGQAYARRYTAAKRAAGLVDFDDLIRRTVALLDTPGIADWVRYKLDQATDHILVDEAQDTNADQWSIVAALAGEFFAGEGARGERVRTIFTVGDFKQAIFGFQGTDPASFEAARRIFERKAEEADRPFANLALEQSFRSTPPVLDVVDRLLDEVGGEALGLLAPHGGHRSAKDGPGRVTLWKPHTPAGPEEESEAEGEEGWLDDATRSFATLLARQVRAWLHDATPLYLPGKGRRLQPEDVMILVRKRGALASLIVARLHAEGVPVAGVDRLRLTAPLAVKDLLAAIRFVLQPEDDLNLASLLVSPLFGLSQDELFSVAYGRRGSLLTAVSRSDFAATADALNALLVAADFGTPYRFLEMILSGPMDGRRKLLVRLGEEARDPIEELLNAALAFEDQETPSLQLFLDWFDSGDIDIKRDPSAPLDAVRVMTVHGAKGLQSPLVILADATLDPDDTPARSVHWAREDGPPVPIYRPRKSERFPPFADGIAQAEQREREEHWRLLYVALTRAEEHLVIGGALHPRKKGVTAEDSWHAAVERAMTSLEADWSDDALWGAARHHVGGSPKPARERRRSPPLPLPREPAWLRVKATPEARPPRPLAPSSLGTDDVSDPPPTPALAEAARRGRLLHALFERLPALAPDRRLECAERWLIGSAGVDRDAAAALARDACAIISDARFADIFGPQALAEAPIAAIVSGEVIAGTVDRLLVTDSRIQVIDFKTGRRAPATLDTAPEHHIRQIAAYAAALGVIFPGRAIEAALLYTAGPQLIDVPADVLAAHAPGRKAELGAAEQSLGASR